MQSACLTQSAFFADDAHLDNLRKSIRNTGKKLSQIKPAKVSERYIQSVHAMCSVMFRFFL